MSDFINTVDKDTRDAGAQFIRRIKDGVLSKKILPNSFDEYPLEAASKSFDSLLNSEEFDALLGKRKSPQ
ncbi:MAG: hypothetical protein JNM27_18425 [Leptospirales bacterium]|nr:hypothetical protein [Leptospirales bacterium]